MKYLLKIFVVILFFISCQKEAFDLTEHNEVNLYRLNTTKINISQIVTKNLKNDSDQTLKKLILGDTLIQISDSLIIEQLENLGFEKLKIQTDKFEQTKEILTSRLNTDNNSKCMPIYTDFIVLKYRNQTTGVIKICYECDIFNYFDSKTLKTNLLSNESVIKLKKQLNQKSLSIK